MFSHSSIIWHSQWSNHWAKTRPTLILQMRKHRGNLSLRHLFGSVPGKGEMNAGMTWIQQHYVKRWVNTETIIHNCFGDMATQFFKLHCVLETQVQKGYWHTEFFTKQNRSTQNYNDFSVLHLRATRKPFSHSTQLTTSLCGLIISKRCMPLIKTEHRSFKSSYYRNPK